MIIRNETADDKGAVRRVVLAAFGQVTEADLVAALQASGDAEFSLVAEAEDGNIVGHILFSKLQAPNGCLGLAPVSVLPARQNQAIGSKLIRAGLAQAEQLSWGAVFLLGAPDYYSRFGFEVALADKFETIYPKEYVMALELRPDWLSDQSGDLTYAQSFLDLE
ncbi:MAG: N-acetyltransferase [Rhodospirillaceae bacterium]|jgi:putative acetyltransferase|nr:N-acetyltransferase [Rhodospirillaceae bacterium]MBT4045424.1 N-acetyltransferase [Rhodospirillaceae bacterium]MBT4691501.1 N-acetyltransferase [Rhodospirillaceae bacterium]MBT5083004.1 N-acetyltransferase [Rhodospirillaceae bacterium]MBT5524448.1 N-acetyltransferase [Rhodospirillaceae bacterium]